MPPRAYSPFATASSNSMQVYPFTQGARYQVYAAVGQITDTVRWIIGDTASGSGATRQIQILVKPTRLELMTNLVIKSNLRTYYI
jgi:type IV secretion system protein TrbG